MSLSRFRLLVVAPLLLATTGATFTASTHSSSLAAVKTDDSTCSSVQNGTTYVGHHLGNFTWDFPPSVDAASTCCSAATSYAKQRSKNSTDGIAWTSTPLGPSKTRKGQTSYLCAVYDYGVVRRQSAGSPATSGYTPPLPPFPPAPPKCETFTKSGRGACPVKRCYWTDGVGVPHNQGPSPPFGCFDHPPIQCGDNGAGGGSNGALCIHLRVNNSEESVIDGGSLLNVTVNKNATLKSQVPSKFATDLWLSIGDGEFQKPVPHLQPFQFCVQYQVHRKGDPIPSPEAVVVCMTLTGAFDLQVGTTKRLKYAAEWHSNNPFVAQVTIDTAH